MCMCSVSSVISDYVQPYGTVALQAPRYMGFPRKQDQSGSSCPPPVHLPNSGTEFTSCVSNGLFTVWGTREAPLKKMRFSRREYWNGLPFLSPRDLPDPRIEPRSPALQVDSLPSEPPGLQLHFYGKQGMSLNMGFLMHRYKHGCCHNFKGATHKGSYQVSGTE